jgi:hypothetical protein
MVTAGHLWERETDKIPTTIDGEFAPLTVCVGGL